MMTMAVTRLTDARAKERARERAASPGLDDVDAGCREHYQDALLYDYEYRRRRADVGFYKRVVARLAPEGEPILELACGSCRVTIPLARDGREVVALDSSESMLEQAKARLARQSRAVRGRVQLVHGDMRRFALGRRFPLVVMAFNAFEHLYTRVEVEVALECVHRHLKPGGHLVFDVQNPDLRWLSRDGERRWARTQFTHPRSGQRTIYTSNHVYDPVSQIAVIRLYYQPLDEHGAPAGAEQVVRLSQRKYFPAELEALVHANGFDVRERFGDFDGGPLVGGCEAQVLVCQQSASRAPSDGTEIVAALGLQRDSAYMYFIKGTTLWRMPYGDRERAEPIVPLDIERDPDFVYFLDERGHVVRTPRG